MNDKTYKLSSKEAAQQWFDSLTREQRITAVTEAFNDAVARASKPDADPIAWNVVDSWETRLIEECNRPV